MPLVAVVPVRAVAAVAPLASVVAGAGLAAGETIPRKNGSFQPAEWG